MVGSLVPLKVAKARLELHLGTIPVGVGSGGSNSDYKAMSVQWQLLLSAGTELGNTQTNYIVFKNSDLTT